MYRDFTFIDDIVKGIVSLLNKTPKKIKVRKTKILKSIQVKHLSKYIISETIKL